MRAFPRAPRINAVARMPEHFCRNMRGRRRDTVFVWLSSLPEGVLAVAYESGLQPSQRHFAKLPAFCIFSVTRPPFLTPKFPPVYVNIIA